MTDAEMTMQALRKEVSELKFSMKQLGQENRDLREICNESGIKWEELLAARRHRRYFNCLCADYPIQGLTTPSAVFEKAPIVRGIAACAGSVLRTGLVARSFFAAFTQLTAQLPWTFGGRPRFICSKGMQAW